MLRALAIVAAALVLLIALIALYYMVNVTGLPLCDDPGSLIEDDCVEAGSAARAIGTIVGWVATVIAFSAFGLSIYYAFAGRAGRRMIVTVALTPPLAIATLVLLPVSF